MKKLLLASAATALCANAAFAGSHTNEIKIGIILGYTGPIESMVTRGARPARL